MGMMYGGQPGNFPGRGSLMQRDLGSGMAPTGGARRPQELMGAAGAAGYDAPNGPLGGPSMSQMPGYSFKGGPGTPRYHEEMPLGGTPGVWAIRLDELGGPKADPFGTQDEQAARRHSRRGRSRRRANRGTRRR